MTLAFLLDENVRGRLSQAIDRHNASTDLPLDVHRVGDAIGPPLGIGDPELLHWIERESRLLVSFDKSTLPQHLQHHLEAGRHVPGILLVRRGTSVTELVEYLVVVAYASELAEWQDRIEYIG